MPILLPAPMLPSKSQKVQIEHAASLSSAIAASMHSPMEQIARSLSESARHSLISVFHEIHERNRELMQQVVSSFVIKLPTIDLYSGIGNTTEAYEAEIVSENEMNMERVSLPVKRERSNLSLTTLAGGSFRYKRNILKGIAAGKSNPGRLLAFLLKQKTYFANDEEVRQELHLPDNRDLGYVIRGLKDAFKKNGLVIEIERRWNPDGYQIIKIQQIQ